MQHSWRLNDGVAMVLVAIVAVAPMPLASNRPMFWMISATFVFLTAGVFIVNIARKKRALPVSLRQLWLPCVIVGVYLVVMACEALGGLYSATPNASFLAMLHTLSYATFFFLVLQVAAKPKRASWMLKALFYAVVVYALIGFLARFGVVQFPEILISSHQFNATATFVNPNSFATFLGFGLLTGAYLTMRRSYTMWYRSSPHRVARIFLDVRLMLYTAGILVISVTLFATNSRMGIFAIICALAVFMLVIAIKT